LKILYLGEIPQLSALKYKALIAAAKAVFHGKAFIRKM